jgi:hypothetical protein
MAGQAGPEVTSDDKLWALLTYVFTPLVPIIILLMEDKKNRPFLKAHNAQALFLGIILDGLCSVYCMGLCHLLRHSGLWRQVCGNPARHQVLQRSGLGVSLSHRVKWKAR